LSENKEAIDRAKELAAEGDGVEVLTLSTGYRGRIVPVGASLIDEIVARVKVPEVPTFFNEEKGREEENPTDPKYLKELQEAQQKRVKFSLDAMVMFGLELEDGLPENDRWLQKLKYMEKIGALDLSDYDLDDPFEKEFVFKRYIAVGTVDLVAIGRKAGLSPAAVEEAAKSFPSQ
jgi:hypothetical protein